MQIPLFIDRQDAGIQLASAVASAIATLPPDQLNAQPIVYALPKGGLPVAEPVAQYLSCPLDVIVAKKVTRPDNPELAIGAVTADGYTIQSRQACLMPWDQHLWQKAVHEAQIKANLQLEQFAAYRPPVEVQGAIAIVVDDGIATGMTMTVAVHSLKAKHPACIIVCTPVAPQQLMPTLERWGDRAIVLATPEAFVSVSRFYAEFHQVEMEEALACLARANQRSEREIRFACEQYSTDT
jgi:predicted phosphoribosyltransferase